MEGPLHVAAGLGWFSKLSFGEAQQGNMIQSVSASALVLCKRLLTLV